MPDIPRYDEAIWHFLALLVNTDAAEWQPSMLAAVDTSPEACCPRHQQWQRRSSAWHPPWTMCVSRSSASSPVTPGMSHVPQKPLRAVGQR